MSEEQEVRPRYGVVHRRDGSKQMVVFLPSDMRDVYRAVDAGTEEPIAIFPGETINVVGKMRLGQGILYRLTTDNQERVGRIKARGPGGIIVSEDKKPNSPWRGLAMLFGLGAFVLFMAWGIKAIFSG